MTFALATLVFLSAAWFAVQAILSAIDGKTSRILSALRGDIPVLVLPVTVRISPRYPSRPMRQARSLPRLRAAA
jgi:hypothetical protein